MKPLLIGQAPGRAWRDGDRALGGLNAKKLARLAGVTPEHFLSALDTVNLLAAWPGKNGKGDQFPLGLARARAAQLADVERTRDTVVFVGEGVAIAFGFDDLTDTPCAWWMYPAQYPWRRVAYLPHPSGVNQWWNDRAHLKRAATFLRTLFDEPAC